MSHTQGLTQNYAVNGQPGKRHKDKQLLLTLLSHIFIIQQWMSMETQGWTTAKFQ